MQVSEYDINIFLKAQELDIALNKAKKSFDELPQRQAILASRQKQETINQKRDKVLAMKADLDKKMVKLVTEDEVLQQKQKDVQAAIVAAGTDYRNLESRTKELAGHEKRRNVLAEELEVLDSQMSQVQAMVAQVDKVLLAEKGQEEKTIASFRQEGGDLQLFMADLTKQRKALLDSLDVSAVQLYERKLKEGKGVAIGLLNGDRCGICRTGFDVARMLDIKSQAPLAECPHCKRLLVV